MAVGPNPTDRGKGGTKRHLITDRHGIPLAVRLTGANRHDSLVFANQVNAVPLIRTPTGRWRKRLTKLHADKVYDLPAADGSCARATSRCGSRGGGSSPANG